MHRMVNELPVDEKALRRYFQSENYYGAIVRLNGLPSRYGERGKKEIFSDINEMMLAYGVIHRRRFISARACLSVMKIMNR